MNIIPLLNVEATPTFEWKMLIPLIILLAIAAIIPVIISICRLKFIPCLVVEIIMGIVIASIPFTKNLFVSSTNSSMLATLPEGLYMIGMAMLLFLSGLDTDYSVLKLQKKGAKKTLNVFKLSWILILFVILFSAGGSLLFTNYFKDQSLLTVSIGVILLTILFSSTFASLVIPLVHDEKMQNTTIGKLIDTYATIAEFLSILSLSILMITLQIVEDAKPWLLIIVIIVLLLVYIVKRFVPITLFKKSMEGIVHLNMRLIILVLLSLVILAQVSGAEFILGAFLAGMVIKSAKISEHTLEKIESLGYGIFVPMFYILVGFKVGLIMPLNEFINPSNLVLIGLIFLVLVVVKLPFLILCKWYKLSTVIPTMFIITSTIIVGIAGEHFGIFSEQLFSAIVVASAITCLIPPIFFATGKKYGFAKDEYDEIIVNPNELDEEGNEIIN